MAVLQQQIIWDTTSVANFNSASSSISAALAQMGLVQTNDTGQVVWTASLVAISGATRSGSNTIYNYTLSSGPVLRIGMSFIITGMANGGNNGTFTVTALGAGTFTVANASGVTESGSTGSGTTTANASVPANNFSSTFTIYEVWKFNDSLASTCPIFLKIWYGTTSVQSTPIYAYALQLQVGTGSNGTGTLTGNTFQVQTIWYNGSNFSTGNNWGSTNTGTTPWECNFSYDSGRIAMMLWRNCSTPAIAPCLFAIERSRDQYGNYTASYFTVVSTGTFVNSFSSTAAYTTSGQASIFAPNTGGIYSNTWGYPGNNPFATGMLSTVNVQIATLYGGTFAVLPIFPMVGKADNPLTSVVVVKAGDQSEGGVFTASMYGTQHTFLFSKAFSFQLTNQGHTTVIPNGNGMAIRWD